MDVTKISAGRNPPSDLNAIIEIPVGGTPVKYELDKASGAMFVDRFLHTAMYYPGNYGFIPQTLSQDGDPCDVLVIAPVAVASGAVIRCRPVGSAADGRPGRSGREDYRCSRRRAPSFLYRHRFVPDLPEIMREQIAHFFNHYKDLEEGKWTRMGQWVDVENAKRLILEAI